MYDELKKPESVEVVLAKHEMRLTALENLIKVQTDAIQKIQSRFTIIGSALVGVIGVSSEQGGLLLRSLLGG